MECTQAFLLGSQGYEIIFIRLILVISVLPGKAHNQPQNFVSRQKKSMTK